MAAVYRAWDSELRVWRAIKVLLPEYAQRHSVRTRFEREASTMALLEHPHVIRVYDVVSSEALPFMVMELAEGGNLIGWLDAYGSMPPGLACKVVAQVAQGLGAAHAVKVVHRDVKPHNVLISLSGQCKVTDFGIARVRTEGATQGMTRTGSTMGTIGYMAPEQRADAKYVDERADIYSLGALLYKLVTGTIVTDLFLVEHEPQLLEKVPEPLHELVIRACYHDRERRFATTDAFNSTLSELRPLLPRDPPDTPPLQIPIRDNVLEPVGADPFPEIAVLLADGRDDPPAEDAAQRPLPYRIPAFDALGSAAQPPPDYIAPLPPPPPQMGLLDPEDALSESPLGSVRGATPLPVPPAVHASDPGHAAPHPTELPSPLVRWLAIVSASAWGALLLLALLGASQVRGAQREARSSQQALYITLNEEQSLMAELRRAGVSRAELRALEDRFVVFEKTQGEPAKLLAATRVARALEEEGGVHFAGRPDSDLVVARLHRVQRARDQAVDARRRWNRRGRSGPGALAVGLRLAELPE